MGAKVKKPKPTMFGGQLLEPSARKTREPGKLWIPETQARWVQPPMPGKRDDGKLWFEETK